VGIVVVMFFAGRFRKRAHLMALRSPWAGSGVLVPVPGR